MPVCADIRTKREEKLCHDVTAAVFLYETLGASGGGKIIKPDGQRAPKPEKRTNPAHH